MTLTAHRLTLVDTMCEVGALADRIAFGNADTHCELGGLGGGCGG